MDRPISEVRNKGRANCAVQLPMSLRAATICEAFQITAAEHAARIAFPADGDEPPISWAQYAARVAGAASGLVALGLRRGDTVALMLINRREFHWMDAATAHLGVASTSIYNTAPPEQIRHVIEDSGARIVLTEQAFVARMLPFATDGTIDRLVAIDAPESSGQVLSWADILAGADPGFDIGAAIREVEPEDVLCVMYTSGSTGVPKGVELSHRNMLFLLRAMQERLGIPVGASQLSFLPMAHGMARVFDHYMQITLAFEVTCCPRPQDIGPLLPVVRPSFFASTPRLWEKLRASVHAAIAAEPDAKQRTAAEATLSRSIAGVHTRQQALATGANAAEYEPTDADRQILTQLAAVIGMDRMRAGVVGGAPVDAELLEFFHAIGVPLGEAYGLSECGAGATANPPQRVKCGTVGPPLPGVELKLANDGEILIKGPGIMKGYRNRPEDTRAAFDADGWLRTGDIGAIDDDGYVRIIDRKKEIIINSAGKNMSPVHIESTLKHACPLVGHTVAIGDRRPYVVALIAPEPEAVSAFAQSHGIRADEFPTWIDHPLVAAEIAKGVDQANQHLARAEQIKHYAVLHTPWEPASDELTATMKLRRREVLEKYRPEIDRLYHEADARHRQVSAKGQQ
jgi:long-subunit acyl-CoA synthetase (AMP-forming)